MQIKSFVNIGATYRHDDDNTDHQLQHNSSNWSVAVAAKFVEKAGVWQAAVTSHSPNQMATCQN
jgi:hypothetical protein